MSIGSSGSRPATTSGKNSRNRSGNTISSEASSSSNVHQRASSKAAASSASRCCGSHSPPSGHQATWMRSFESKWIPAKSNSTCWVQMQGPTSTSVNPASSHSSRRAPAAESSPGPKPPPGISHHGPLWGSMGSLACIKKMRPWRSNSTTRAAGRRKVQAMGADHTPLGSPHRSAADSPVG